MKTTKSSPGRFLKLVKRQLRLIAKPVVQRLRRAAPEDKRVVFVAGVQRSGTNMMMNVLDRSLQTEVYHERDHRAFDHYEMRPPEDIRRLVDASPASHVVIKALCELQDLDALLERFRPARAIWVLRDYDDVVNSHLKLWTGMPETIRRIVADRESAAWRGRGMSDETHALLREHYHPEISNASACALFWYFRNVLYFEHHLDRHPDIRLVRYEDLVTNPHEMFPMVFDFLGLRYTPRVSGFVTASSVRKAAPPDIDPAVRALCDSLEQRFRRNDSESSVDVATDHVEASRPA